jgi:hypothetical protein
VGVDKTKTFWSPSPSSPEGVKKLVWCCFTSFRRKPESSVFMGLQILWTPVFTGETNTVRFFHTFPPTKGRGDFWKYMSNQSWNPQ